MFSKHEMLDIVLVNGVARGIIARNLINGQLERYSANAVVLATGGSVSYTHLTLPTKA